MTGGRFKSVNGELVPMSDDEIKEADASYALWAANEASRAKVTALETIAALEQSSGLPRALRDIILKDEGNGAYAKAKALEDEIQALKKSVGL